MKSNEITSGKPIANKFNTTPETKAKVFRGSNRHVSLISNKQY